MRKTRKQKKAASLATALCFVATIAIAGAYTLSGNNRNQATKENVEREPEKMAKEANITAKDPVKNLVLDNAKETEPAENNDEEVLQVPVSAPKPVASQGTGIYFQEGNKLLWPVEGTVLMAYSMDKTVYHETLNQYKYNPAMILSAAEGDQVICGGAGMIKSIDNNARTGLTVNVDFGNGYEALYGQLCDIPVRVGDYVEGKTLLGYVTKPTKYYSVEGPNVYFEMRKDGLPVDPEGYLTEDW